MTSQNTVLARNTAFRIAFDQCDHNTLTYKGKIYGITLEKEREFHSLPQMILVLNEIFDIFGFPQASTRMRSFRRVPKRFNPTFDSVIRYHDVEMIDGIKGKACSLDLLCTTRFHSSVQGILFEETGKFISEFNSELELIDLIENHRN